MSTGNDDDVYDIADEPPVPVVPVTPAPIAAAPVTARTDAPTLGYQAPQAMKRQLAVVETEALLPSWKLPAALIAIGALALYGPFLFESPTLPTFIFITSYVAVRFVMMLIATLALAYLVDISFGAGGSYLLRLLAITLVAEGTVVASAFLGAPCFMIPVGLLASFAITGYLFNKLFEIELPENLYAAMAYWLPGVAGFILVWRMTTWVAGWLL